jgi:hypothetical protein
VVTSSLKITAILFAEVKDCVIGEADNLTIRMKEWSFNYSLVLGKIGGWSLEFDSLMIALCALYIFSGIRLILYHEVIS